MEFPEQAVGQTQNSNWFTVMWALKTSNVRTLRESFYGGHFAHMDLNCMVDR
jgi:hypothetical protein